MDKINNFVALGNHLVGWTAIVGTDDYDIRSKIDAGLNAFAGEYGLNKEITVNRGFGFGFRAPDVPLPLTTWSFFETPDKTCFIEGVFYDESYCKLPVPRQNGRLAQLFLEEFTIGKEKAIEKLNGVFSGFVFDHKKRNLITFIDRFGVKIIYWTYEDDTLLLSTNLAAFRSLKSLAIDHTAAFQFLTLGFPMGERTLLKDVNIQLPCTMNSFTGSEKYSIRYWNVPKRINNMSLDESVEMIGLSMEGFVDRLYNRNKHEYGVALSGGHDSRFIASSLSYKGIPFLPISLKGRTFDDKISKKICSILSEKLIIVDVAKKKLTDYELNRIRTDTFAHSDGTYFYPIGFSMMARECSDYAINCLMMGFAGDVISGSSITPAPQYLDSIEQLARYSLETQMENLSFMQAMSLLTHAGEEMIHETEAEWSGSFFNESSSCDDLLSISIWQRLLVRNFRRIRFAFSPMFQYAQIIFPYLDNKILDAYFTIPIQFLYHQKAHCYAGFRRFNKLGNYQASGFPMSLKEEATFPLGLYMARLGYSKFNKFLSRLKSPYKGRCNSNYMAICDEISKSSLFDSGFLKKLFFDDNIRPFNLHKIHTLCRFYEFYIDKSTYSREKLGDLVSVS